MADYPYYEAPAYQASALPVDAPAKLIGRDTTLARVYTHLKDNKAVLLHGAPGIGKTAVAVTLASAYTELPGGSLWLHVENPTFAELIVRVGRAYNVPNVITSDNPTAFVGAIASTLARTKPLIVLDGSIGATEAEEFLTRCAVGLPMLIVNDTDIDGSWIKFPLNPLEPSQAAALLRASAELPPGDVPDADINGLVTALGAIPFALVIAGGHLKATSASPAEFRAALPPAGSGVNPALLALAVGFRGLNSTLQGLLMVLGATFKGQASAPLISLIGKAPTDKIEAAMATLVTRRMVEKSTRAGQAYYRLHPLTFTFMQSWLKGSGRLNALQTSARDAILAYARQNTDPSAAAHDRLAAEMETFVAAAKWASDQGERDLATALSVALMQAGDFVNGRGYVYELLNLRRLAASSTTAFPAYTAPLTPPAPVADVDDDADDFDDDEDEDVDDLPLETPGDHDDDFDDDDDDLADDDDLDDEDELEDELDEPLPSILPAMDDDLDDDDLESDDDDLEDDDLDDDDFEDDDEIDDDEIDVLPPIELTPAPLTTLEPVIAFVSDDDDDDLESFESDDDEDLDEDDLEDEDEPELEEAAPLPVDEVMRLRESLVQARQAGDRRRQAEVIVQIARLLRERGMDDQAIASYTEALNLQEALDDTAGMLTTLQTLAELTAKTENLQASALYAQRGANAAEKRGDDGIQIRLLTMVGDTRQELGESADAVRAYEQALDVARTASDAMNEAVLLFKLGYAQLDDTQPQEAIKSWEEALTLFRKQNRRDYEGRVLGGLGAAYGELERWTEALNFHTSALHIAREVKDKDEELLQLNLLGYASVQARQLGQAVLRYRQALHLAFVAGDKENIVGTSIDLARLLVESPRHLSIAELLVDSGLLTDSTSRDLRRLKERIEDEREALGVDAPPQANVAGSARDYAANGYSLLDQ